MSDHFPVMLNEVLENISPKDGEVYVDGTFGAGGYTKAFLDSADCTVIAIDRDPAALERANDLKGDYAALCEEAYKEVGGQPLEED